MKCLPIAAQQTSGKAEWYRDPQRLPLLDATRMIPSASLSIGASEKKADGQRKVGQRETASFLEMRRRNRLRPAVPRTNTQANPAIMNVGSSGAVVMLLLEIVMLPSEMTLPLRASLARLTLLLGPAPSRIVPLIELPLMETLPPVTTKKTLLAVAPFVRTMFVFESESPFEKTNTNCSDEFPFPLMVIVVLLRVSLLA